MDKAILSLIASVLSGLIAHYVFQAPSWGIYLVALVTYYGVRNNS